jgi:hypothetical protein
MKIGAGYVPPRYPLGLSLLTSETVEIVAKSPRSGAI